MDLEMKLHTMDLNEVAARLATREITTMPDSIDHTHVKQQGMGYTYYDCDGTICPPSKDMASIALTRIHTPEDYWNRMNLAEQKLWDMYVSLRFTTSPDAKLCQRKALQLSDRYHEHWTTTRKEYFG